MRVVWVAVVSSALLSTAQGQTSQPLTPATHPVRQWRFAALSEVKASAEAGIAEAQIELAGRLEAGRGVACDPSAARSWRRKAADQGNVEAEMALATTLIEGTEANQKEAAKLYQKAADAGNARAVLELGLCFKEGKGLKPNPHKAIEWFKKSAEAGDPDAEYQLGECCRTGAGVDADASAAAEHFKNASDAGNADAMTALAAMYRSGEGVDPQPHEALALYLRAAAKGSASAQWELAKMYRDGDGVNRDPDKAVIWLKKLVLEKHAEAQHALALLDLDDFKQIARPLRMHGDVIDEHEVAALVKLQGEVISTKAGTWKILVKSFAGPGHLVEVKPPLNMKAILAQVSGRSSTQTQRIHEEHGDARALHSGPAPLSGTDPTQVHQGMLVSVWGRPVDQSRIDAIVFQVEPPSFKWSYKLRDVAGLAAGRTQNYTLLGSFKNTGRTPLRNVKLHVRAYEESSTSEFSKDYVIDQVKAGETLNFTIDFKLHNYSTSGGTSLPKVEMEVTEYQY